MTPLCLHPFDNLAESSLDRRLATRGAGYFAFVLLLLALASRWSSRKITGCFSTDAIAVAITNSSLPSLEQRMVYARPRFPHLAHARSLAHADTKWSARCALPSAVRDC